MHVYLGCSSLWLKIPIISELTCGLSLYFSYLYLLEILILQICDYTMTSTDNPAQTIHPGNQEPILKYIEIDRLSIYHTSSPTYSRTNINLS